MRTEEAREKRDLEEKVEETLISVITKDAETDQIEESSQMTDAHQGTATIEDLSIETTENHIEIVMTEDLLTEMIEDHTEIATTEDHLIEMTEDLSTEMRDASQEIARKEDHSIEMIEDLSTETRDASQEIARKEDHSIEMTEDLSTEMKDASQETVTTEDLLIEMTEDPTETATIEDLSIEVKDVSLEKARMILLDSIRAREISTIRLLEERRALQSHMAMILSWQQRTERRLQLIGFRARKASITEATNNRLWWEENPTIFFMKIIDDLY